MINLEETNLGLQHSVCPHLISNLKSQPLRTVILLHQNLNCAKSALPDRVPHLEGPYLTPSPESQGGPVPLTHLLEHTQSPEVTH